MATRHEYGKNGHGEWKLRENTEEHRTDFPRRIIFPTFFVFSFEFLHFEGYFYNRAFFQKAFSALTLIESFVIVSPRKQFKIEVFFLFFLNVF